MSSTTITLDLNVSSEKFVTPNLSRSPNIDLAPIDNIDNVIYNVRTLHKKLPCIFDANLFVNRSYFIDNIDVDTHEELYKVILGFTPVSILHELKNSNSLVEKEMETCTANAEIFENLDLDEDPEVFEDQVSDFHDNWKRNIMPNTNIYNYADGFDIFGITNPKNALKNLDLLHAKFPEMFELLVAKHQPLVDNSQFECHYLAECKSITDPEVIQKIVSFTPEKILKEILEEKECKYPVFKEILKKLSM